ncbi:MAG: hypothetical protein R3B81_13965 [bacterium]|nr:hypothetical protein [Gemmatimonadota bacterium]
MEIILGVGFFILAIAALSLGTLAFRRPIKGSCGGVMGEACACGRKYEECPDRAPAKESVGH